jgi:hypothetical protein
MALGHPLATVDLPVLEDRCAIQMAISEVVQALAGDHMDCRRALALLYGLQIASQNAGRSTNIAAIRPVRALVQSPDGEEMGPAVITPDLSDIGISDTDEPQTAHEEYEAN